jgi:hypothetical protein
MYEMKTPAAPRYTGIAWRANTPIENRTAPTSTRFGSRKSRSGCRYAASRNGPTASASTIVTVATKNPSGIASTTMALVASAARKRPPRYSAL